MAVGSISESKFCELVNEFWLISRRINDTWEIRNSTGSGEIYLVKKITVPNKNSQQTPDILPGHQHLDTLDNPENISVTEDFRDEETDVGCLVTNNSEEILTYEYHILYSTSYSVPVLYFNVYQSNGKLLPLEEVWNRVPDIYQQEIMADKWSILTQQEHPLLGRPFYQLHPCHTSMMMNKIQQMSQTRGNYLITWLSTVGPVVGLNLSMQFADIQQQHTESVK